MAEGFASCLQVVDVERAALARMGQLLTEEKKRLRQAHHDGEGGLNHARRRDIVYRELLACLFERACILSVGEAGANDVASGGVISGLSLVATGGFGRGVLNPCSDIDLLFLTAKPARRLPAVIERLIHDTLYPLWDFGLEVGYAVRCRDEVMEMADQDIHSLTSLLEATCISGNSQLFAEIKSEVITEFLQGDPAKFVLERVDAIRQRHKRFGNTVFLQEPNVKESPGGLRDLHHLTWFGLILGEGGWRQLLTDAGLLSLNCVDKLARAEDFLHRARNALHYNTRRSNDILTLRLQGELADELGYPQANILRRIEAFMRDYYSHTSFVFEQCGIIFDQFEIEVKHGGLPIFKCLRGKTEEQEPLANEVDQDVVETDEFLIADGFISAAASLFQRDSSKILEIFKVAQSRRLWISPEARNVLRESLSQIDKGFRARRFNQDIFRSILEQKGEVAVSLRQMHRVGVLGKFIPEFGALDCLVQHEFFHRYTADEHTLRCIDELDSLASGGPEFFRKLFREMSDPFAMYVALLMHDTGRAENVREHIDGSALLTMRACNRLRIRGGRRRLITFLVDNHLTFWRYATSKNLEENEVIEEFANIVKSVDMLDALFLFTYVDSRGTNEENWNQWKESLMMQLYRYSRAFLEQGQDQFEAERRREKARLLGRVRRRVSKRNAAYIEDHFRLMPDHYFHFREVDSLAIHLRAIRQFVEREQASGDQFECAVQWIERPARGYTEFIIVGRSRPFFIERVCCAMASEEVNVLSADIFTRDDGIALDALRVTTPEAQAVMDRDLQSRVVEKIYQLNLDESYDPQPYLKKRTNFLRRDEPMQIDVPVRATLNNDLSRRHSLLEIQAIDRIGLLHDLFRIISDQNLQIVSARISTEKGMAVDTLRLLNGKGGKVTDPETIECLERAVEAVISIH